jgi:hypothetical protein
MDGSTDVLVTFCLGAGTLSDTFLTKDCLLVVHHNGHKAKKLLVLAVLPKKESRYIISSDWIGS